MRRALNTVNALALGGDIDVEVSTDLALSPSLNFSLENLDGSSTSGSVAQRYGSAGNFFPTDGKLRKLVVSGVPPGNYVIRVKGNVFDLAANEFVERTATLPVELNALDLHLASLSFTPNATFNGASRVLSYELQSEISGTLYGYALGQASATCPRRSQAELMATPAVQTHAITGYANSVTGSVFAATAVADADTFCIQFVRATDTASEAPYTFNVRYLALPSTGNLMLDVVADAAAVPKAALSLVSLPSDPNLSGLGMFKWIDRRQLFTSGDRVQQTTSNSGRITLTQTNGGWNYTIAAPMASDHPFYVANVEGQPPRVFYIKP